MKSPAVARIEEVLSLEGGGASKGRRKGAKGRERAREKRGGEEALSLEAEEGVVHCAPVG